MYIYVHLLRLKMLTTTLHAYVLHYIIIKMGSLTNRCGILYSSDLCRLMWAGMLSSLTR